MIKYIIIIIIIIFIIIIIIVVIIIIICLFVHFQTSIYLLPYTGEKKHIYENTVYMSQLNICLNAYAWCNK